MIELDPSARCACGCGGFTKLSDRTDAKRGVVRGKPLRYVSGHNRRGHRTTPLSESYAVRDCGYVTPCWVWRGSINGKTGYGHVYAGNAKSTTAHRAMYELHVGPVPVGLTLDHLCRNRACCNPAHLEPVTNAENSRRGAKTKLTAADVAAIRRSSLTHERVAEQYDVHPSHISRIRNAERWLAR